LTTLISGFPIGSRPLRDMRPVHNRMRTNQGHPREVSFCSHASIVPTRSPKK